MTIAEPDVPWVVLGLGEQLWTRASDCWYRPATGATMPWSSLVDYAHKLAVVITLPGEPIPDSADS